MVKEICKEYRSPFSVTLMEGGYFHDDGTWVDENSLMITLLSTPKDTVYKIARDVCKTFHQESVIIVIDKVISFNIHDKEKPNEMIGETSLFLLALPILLVNRDGDDDYTCSHYCQPAVLECIQVSPYQHN